MDDERRHVLADFLRDQLQQTPRTLRILCVLALLLCGFGLSILLGVTLSGAAPLSEVGPPLVAFLGLPSG